MLDFLSVVCYLWVAVSATTGVLLILELAAPGSESSKKVAHSMFKWWSGFTIFVGVTILIWAVLFPIFSGS